MSEIPDRFFIEEEDKEIYDNLKSKNTPLGKYKTLENKDVFILAVCFGYTYGIRKPLEKKFGYVRPIYFKERELNLLYTMGFNSKEKLDAYSDFKKVYEIIEEYANGGLHILKDKVYSGEFGTFEKQFEGKLVNLYREFFSKKSKMKKDIAGEMTQ